MFSVKYSLSPIILPVVCSKLPYLIARRDKRKDPKVDGPQDLQRPSTFIWWRWQQRVKISPKRLNSVFQNVFDLLLVVNMYGRFAYQSAFQYFKNLTLLTKCWFLLPAVMMFELNVWYWIKGCSICCWSVWSVNKSEHLEERGPVLCQVWGPLWEFVS